MNVLHHSWKPSLCLLSRCFGAPMSNFVFGSGDTPPPSGPSFNFSFTGTENPNGSSSDPKFNLLGLEKGEAEGYSDEVSSDADEDSFVTPLQSDEQGSLGQANTNPNMPLSQRLNALTIAIKRNQSKLHTSMGSKSVKGENKKRREEKIRTNKPLIPLR